MRLTPFEQQMIKEAFVETLGQGSLYLFGSRVQDHRKGGDIDLYFLPRNLKPTLSQRIDFLVKLKSKIGEQKIDLVVGGSEPRLIDKLAIETGVLLCKC